MAVSEKILSDKIEKSSLAEELRKEREDNRLTFDTKYSHKEDLENLLRLAEELKEKSDKTEQTLRKWKVLRLLVFLVSIFLTLLTFSEFKKNFSEFNINDFIGIFLGPSGFLTMLLAYNFISKDLSKTYLADKLALSEVLQLLRETSNVIVEQEDWSVLSRAEFRIRLSRFNLEEKSKSAFNFFS